MRAFEDTFLGRTNSLGGFDVLAGSAFCVDVVGSGVVSVGVALAGFERVRAMAATVCGIGGQLRYLWCTVSNGRVAVGRVARQGGRAIPVKTPVSD